TEHLETRPNARKARIPAHSGVSLERRPNAGVVGWGGRGRTSEWRNQNPLPFRLATPQQACSGSRWTIARADSLWQRRSIGGVEPFQPPRSPIFGKSQARWFCRFPAVNRHPAPPLALHRVETMTVSWEDGSP